jgi:nicotinamide-nucleotide amidase
MNDPELNRLAGALGERLSRAGLVLATAESCTGGWISKCITDVAGSSAWLDRGFVTYSNAAKRDSLGVREQTLITHGAVSEPVALEMVAGALANSTAQVAVAVSGIAGPGGGTELKPVGTVCFGFALPAGLSSETRRFDGDRDAVRRQAVRLALTRLIDLVGREAGDPAD